MFRLTCTVFSYTVTVLQVCGEVATKGSSCAVAEIECSLPFKLDISLNDL